MGGKVRIEWQLPFNNGAEITKYEVVIEEKDGDFSEETVYCDGS